MAGRVVMVSGASSGVGEATALALAAGGAHVIAGARRADRLADLIERIGTAGGTAQALPMDITSESSVARGFEQIRTQHGKLDGLVNAAGRMGRGGGIYTDTADWRASIETNLLGVMLVVHAALPLMLANRGATIVNVSSTATNSLNVGSAPYSSAKVGVNIFSEALRRELVPHGVRVTVVSPGLIATEFASHAPDEATKVRYQKWLTAMTPLAAADVANEIVHVLGLPPHVNLSAVVMRPAEQDD
jgi:NADP-dependent 3-hydroxy acid dehydrogenase YdfG